MDCIGYTRTGPSSYLYITHLFYTPSEQQNGPQYSVAIYSCQYSMEFAIDIRAYAVAVASIRYRNHIYRSYPRSCMANPSQAIPDKIWRTVLHRSYPSFFINNKSIFDLIKIWFRMIPYHVRYLLLIKKKRRTDNAYRRCCRWTEKPRRLLPTARVCI